MTTPFQFMWPPAVTADGVWVFPTPPLQSEICQIPDDVAAYYTGFFGRLLPVCRAPCTGLDPCCEHREVHFKRTAVNIIRMGRSPGVWFSLRPTGPLHRHLL